MRNSVLDYMRGFFVRKDRGDAMFLDEDGNLLDVRYLGQNLNPATGKYDLEVWFVRPLDGEKVEI